LEEQISREDDNVTEVKNIGLVDELVNTEEQRCREDQPGGRCDPLDVNSIGRTALHVAMSMGKSDAALYLLSCGSVQREPRDKSGDSLLISACMSGCSYKCIESILEQWPDYFGRPDAPYILGPPDSQYDRSPVSWACERSSRDVVNKLISYYDGYHLSSELNRRDYKQQDYTPLHFAAERAGSSVLDLLLSKDMVNIRTFNSRGEWPVHLAMQARIVTNTRLLLSHKQMDADRMDFLAQLCDHIEHPMHGIVAEIMDHVTPEFMNHDISALINESEDLYNPGPYTALIEWVFKHGLQHRLPLLYHSAARIGRLDLMDNLLTSSISKAGDLDEDNWSMVKYAHVYSPARPIQPIEAFFEQHTPGDFTQPPLEYPKELLLGSLAKNFEISASSDSGLHKSVTRHGKLTHRPAAAFVSHSSACPLT
jgi:hypothetical protein